MTQAICGVNQSCYEPEPTADASMAASGGGGAPPASQLNGAEGAGNVEKSGEPEATLRCLPEAIFAAKECGKAALVRNLTSALVCGLRLEALRECLTEPAKK